MNQIYKIVFGFAVLAGAADLQALEAPSVFYGSALDHQRISVHWVDENPNETGFIVYRAGINEFAGSQLVAEIPAYETDWVDTGLAPGTTYFYFIRAKNQTQYSPYSQAAAVTTLPGPPLIPSGLYATPLSGSEILLQWNEVGGENSYTLYCGPSSDPNLSLPVANLQVGVKSFIHQSLTPDTSYFFFIRAHNSHGSSGFSSPVSASTTVSSPAPTQDFEIGNGFPNFFPAMSYQMNMPWSANGWSFNKMGMIGNNTANPFYLDGQGLQGGGVGSYAQTVATNPESIEFYTTVNNYGSSIWNFSVQTSPITSPNSWTTHSVHQNDFPNFPSRAPIFNYKCVTNLGLPAGVYNIRFFKDSGSNNTSQLYLDKIRIVCAGQQILGPEPRPSLGELSELLKAYPARTPLLSHPERVAIRKKIMNALDSHAEDYGKVFMVDPDGPGPQIFNDQTPHPIAAWYQTRVQKVIDELKTLKPQADEVLIWKLYSSSFIVRSPSVTFALDLTEGPNFGAGGAMVSGAAQNQAYTMTHSQINELVDQIDAFFVSHPHHDHYGVVILTNALIKGKIVVASTNDRLNDPDAAGEFVPSCHAAYAPYFDAIKLATGKTLTDPYLNGNLGRNAQGENTPYTIAGLKVHIHYGIQRGMANQTVRNYSYHITTPENFSVMHTTDHKDMASGQTATLASNDSILPWLTTLGDLGCHMNAYLGAALVFNTVFFERYFAVFGNANNFNNDKKILRIPGHEWEWLHYPGGFNRLSSFWSSYFPLHEDVFPLATGEVFRTRNHDYRPANPRLTRQPEADRFKLRAFPLKDQIQLTWEKIPDAAFFRVYRRASDEVDFTAILRSQMPEAVDRTAKTGVGYFYKVASVSQEGAELYTSRIVETKLSEKAAVFMERIAGFGGRLGLFLSESTLRQTAFYEIYSSSGKILPAMSRIENSTLRWDGLLQGGRKAPLGTYILVLRDRERKPIYQGAFVLAW